MDIKNEDESVNIRRADYTPGFTIYVLNLCPGEPDSMIHDLVQNGTVRFETKLAAPLSDTVWAILHTEFENQIKL